MPIVFTLPPNGDFTIGNIFNILDHVLFEASLGSFASGSFTGNGFYFPLSLPSSYVAQGSGFVLGTINGETYITEGVLDSITFTVGGNTVTWTNMNIQMADFSQAAYEESAGIDPTALEDFLLSMSWEMNLSNADDIAPNGSTLGDGVPFNLQGDDVINALDGNDNLFSGGGDDVISGGLGRDILNGGPGDDLLIGGIGNDRLSGSNGNDVLRGFSGSDLLIGGRHDDTLTGGLGADRFLFRDNEGNDVITDFDALNDREVIILRFVSGITDWSDLSDPANGHMTQVGADVLIDGGAGWTVTLENTNIDDLDINDFIF